MHRGWGRGVWVLLAGGLVLTSCRDNRDLQRVRATALIEKTPVDFGEVPLGAKREITVKVKNVGYVPFSAREALLLESSPAFWVDFNANQRLRPGEEMDVFVRFRPHLEGPLKDTLRVVTDADNDPERVVEVRGLGGPVEVELSHRTVDFDVLEVDSDRTMEIEIGNIVEFELMLSVTGANANLFTIDQTKVAPHARQKLQVRYAPTAVGDHTASIDIVPCATCTPAKVQLVGKSVPSAFVFDPAPVPFENIPVHQRTQSGTRATNITWRAVDVTGVRMSDPAFRVLATVAGNRVESKAAMELPMEFQARTVGGTVARMYLEYTSNRARESTVELDARAGRPALALTPVSHDFGVVAVGAKRVVTIRLTNVGTTGPLHFKGVRAEGDVGHFSVLTPHRERQQFPFSAGAWPDIKAPDIAIQPGADYLDVEIAFGPNAVGEYRAVVHFQSDDLFHPERQVVVTGKSRESGPCTFRVLPADKLDFGNVPFGTGAVLGFYFQNTGGAECALRDIRLSNDGGGAFFMPGGEIPGGEVLPNAAFSAQVAFRAPNAGAFKGELEITVNSPTTPVFKLPLVGSASDTCLAAAPKWLDFGAIRYDCEPIPRRTYVSNVCAQPVTVESIHVGAGTSDQYRIVQSPATPRTLAPGEGFEVEVTYSRTVLGQHYSPLYVKAAGEAEPLLIPLLAETNHEGRQVERFVQGMENQLDVLFVVSNTSTMRPYQQRLESAIPGWLQVTESRGVDLRVGVTTTGLVSQTAGCQGGANGGEAGRLFPVDNSRARIIRGTSDGATLQQNLDVGTCHNLVQGLHTMRQALSSPLTDVTDDPRTPQPNDGNAGFLRQTARLAVVFLSDEDDRSGFDVEGYLQFLQALKGPDTSHRTQAHAIVPMDGSCSTAGLPGPRFATVARDTGGSVTNICRSGYSSVLNRLSELAAGLQRDFRLSQPPLSPTDIRVRVNGSTQPQTNWHYDAGNNAVVFAPSAVPTPGQRIDVRYQAACPAPPAAPSP